MILSDLQCNWARPGVETAKIRISTARSPRFSVSGYGTKWRIRWLFSWLVFTFDKRRISQETQLHLVSILTDNSVKRFCRNIGCAQGKRRSYSRLNFDPNLTGFHGHGDNVDQWKWSQRRTIPRWPKSTHLQPYNALHNVPRTQSLKLGLNEVSRYPAREI